MNSLPQSLPTTAVQHATNALINAKISRSDIRRLLAWHVATAAIRDFKGYREAGRALHCSTNTLYIALQNKPATTLEMDRFMELAAAELVSARKDWREIKHDFDHALLDEAFRSVAGRNSRAQAARILGVSGAAVGRMKRRTA